jgi:hypothetical protein
LKYVIRQQPSLRRQPNRFAVVSNQISFHQARYGSERGTMPPRAVVRARATQSRSVLTQQETPASRRLWLIAARSYRLGEGYKLAPVVI